jgi:hypothetical protein
MLVQILGNTPISSIKDDYRSRSTACLCKPDDLLNCAIVDCASSWQQLDGENSASAKLVAQPK